MISLTRWAGDSDRGRIRPVNEDSAYAGNWLYAVADGLGGHVAGEIASATAITALADSDRAAEPARLVEVLADAIKGANTAIRRCAEDNPEFRGMGTTLTALLWSGRTYALAHIGDSRAYRLRNGQLRQLTEDHTLGNLVAATRMSPALSPVISRYLDGRVDRSPDLGLRDALPGDRYLLCSDGLTSVVSDQVIRDALASREMLTHIIERLTGLANSAGGPDNITAIVIDVPDRPAQESVASVMFGAAAT